jgi:hypothetical protein
MKRLSPLLATLAIAALTFGLTGQGTAQTAPNAEIAKQLAPTAVQKAIDRIGSKADGVVVLTQ